MSKYYSYSYKGTDGFLGEFDTPEEAEEEGRGTYCENFYVVEFERLSYLALMPPISQLIADMREAAEMKVEGGAAFLENVTGPQVAELEKQLASAMLAWEQNGGPKCEAVERVRVMRVVVDQPEEGHEG